LTEIENKAKYGTELIEGFCSNFVD